MARSQSVATQFGGTPYQDYSAFLANPELDLVIIATPSLEHARNADHALRAGKVVLLEKPLGVTAMDYQLLRHLDATYPERLYFGYNHRFEPAFQYTLKILQDGLLGEIQNLKLTRHHKFARRNDWQMRLDCGGGQLSVWAPHLLDHGLQLLGGPVKKVNSYLRRILTPGDADDHAWIMLEGENGVVVEVEISNSVAIPGPHCAIYGNRGTLIYSQEQNEIQLKYLDPRFRWDEIVASAEAPALGTDWSAEHERLPWIEETRRVEPTTSLWDHVEIELARHLFEAIRNNVPFPIKNADGLEVVRITEIVKAQNPQFDWIG